MFYSKRLNLLFVASPKTGSTSTAAYLLKLDGEGERFKITLTDRIVDSSCVNSDSLGHATAIELRDVLGQEMYRSLHTFGFVRDPVDKIVSAYFFTRSSELSSAFKIRTPKSKVRMVSKRIVSILLARMLPLSIWAFVFPMKKCSDYFLDESGRVIVDFLGSTDRLNEDLLSILEEIGIDATEAKVPHLNKSRYRSSRQYLSTGGILHKFLRRRYARDIRLYELVKDRHLDSRHRIIEVTD